MRCLFLTSLHLRPRMQSDARTRRVGTSVRPLQIGSKKLNGDTGARSPLEDPRPAFPDLPPDPLWRLTPGKDRIQRAFE